jgi:hypothetical protein
VSRLPAAVGACRGVGARGNERLAALGAEHRLVLDPAALVVRQTPTLLAAHARFEWRRTEAPSIRMQPQRSARRRAVERRGPQKQTSRKPPPKAAPAENAGKADAATTPLLVSHSVLIRSPRGDEVSGSGPTSLKGAAVIGREGRLCLYAPIFCSCGPRSRAQAFQSRSSAASIS